MTRTRIGDIRQNGLNSMLCEIYLQKTDCLSRKPSARVSFLVDTVEFDPSVPLFMSKTRLEKCSN